MRATEAQGTAWQVLRRWQEFDGELRANLLRLAMILAFFTIQLVHFHFWSQQTPADLKFHQSATWIAAAWSLVALGVLLCFRQRVFPPSLMYVTTLLDVALLTALAAAGGAAHSPMVLAYFLILALAALRFSLPLIWTTTAACMLGYLMLIGLSDPSWFDSQHSTPLVQQAVTMLSLLMTGILLGQIIRRTRVLAGEFHARAGEDHSYEPA